MIKLLWLLGPLLAVALGWAWLAWRGRAPSRLTMNVVASLLLLVYLLATAGLGLFWVANQQLPVFDWHYLFGYVTLGLLLLHLGFNARVLWGWWRRGRGPARPEAAAAPGAPATPAAPVAARRRLLGGLGLWPWWLGIGAAAGAGYGLGLRQGRAVIDVAAAPGGSPASTATPAWDALRFVERFHAHTAHSRASVLRQSPGSAWARRPEDFKTYPDAPRLALPPPLQTPGGAGASTDPLARLGRLLWMGAGISEQRGPLALRCAPSSGALFASELYLQVPADPAPGARAADVGMPGDLAGWARLAGCWHHAAQAHALERLPVDTIDARAWTDDAAPSPDDGAPACQARVVVTAVFGRSGHKYGDRTYRYVLADAGHLIENLRLAAAALGWQARIEAGLNDRVVAQALGLDPAHEGVLALLSLVPATPLRPAPSPDPAARPRPALPPAATPAPGATPPWPAAADALDITQAMHLASGGAAAPAPVTRPAAASAPASAAASAVAPAVAPGVAPAVASTPAPAMDGAAASDPAGASNAAPASARPTPARGAPPDLPAAPPPPPDLLALIARRRSVRRWRDEPLPWPRLGALLATLADGPAVLSPALRIDLVAPHVQGLAPGAWRLLAAERRLVQRRAAPDAAALARQAQAAALDQVVVGEAAAVLVLSADRAALAADGRGPARGWRHALLEAGLVGERTYLAAGAQGLAACAVGAFYDDEAAALVGADPAREWVLHFVALGLAA